MLEIIQVNNSSREGSQSTATLPVVLVGCDDVTSAPWLHAGKQLKVNRNIDCEIASVATPSDSRPYISAHGGACIVTTTWPKIDASLLNASDHSFKRSTVILLSQELSEVDFWQPLCWDSYSHQVTIEMATDAILAGVKEAANRRDDWNLVEEFHRRESTLSGDESVVMVAICRGLLNKQIASNFSVSIRTIEQRRRHVFDKMGVESVAPLASRVATVHEIERRGKRRNLPEVKNNRFWNNWNEQQLTTRGLFQHNNEEPIQQVKPASYFESSRLSTFSNSEPPRR